MIKLGHVRYLEELKFYAKSGCNETAEARIKRPEIPDVQVVP